MTTKPKAKKFRIRRSSAAAPDASGATPADKDRSHLAETSEALEPLRRSRSSDGVKQAESEVPQADPPPPAREGVVDSPDVVAAETDLDAIRREGLTGRQLRMARRVAQKHGLSPTSDFDAVALLRAKGIDPFQRSNMLELVVSEEEKSDSRVQLPQTIKPEKQTLPSTEMASPSERRAGEIMNIQRDIAKRRRKKTMLLLTRLAFFVLFPTIVAGYYFYAVATPMFTTKSEFLILKAESGGSMGGFLSGTQFATNQDAIAVQSYLQSKDAMLRLDQDEGFKSHFTQAFIDPIQRLSEDPSNEEAYKVYKRNIEIGYDPTEGVIKMEITAAEPSLAAKFSHALISYAEERVDQLSLRKRSNAVSDAETGLDEAHDARKEAQEKLVRMQQEGAIIDPQARIAALRGQVNNVEIQLQDKQLALQALLDNARPNAAKVDGARGDVRRLQNLLDTLNAQMTTETQGKDSLAEVAVQLQLAQADLATRDLMLQAALERLETARRDADSQARYLTTSVEPVASQDPSYPRKFEDTILAFLIFSGIYLLISLTASILREQVSS